MNLCKRAGPSLGWARFLFLIVLAQCAVPVAEASSGAEEIGSRPAVHHILLEVADLKASIRFYRDYLGLSLTSQDKDFATLESAGAGIYLWQKRWQWEKPREKGERNGLGIYPHFEVADVAGTLDRFRQGGYKIVQQPKSYGWGAEVFVEDPDGFVIALVNMAKGGR